MTGDAVIAKADSAEDIAAVKELFLEYAAWLGEDLCFQGFDEEMDTFPGIYCHLLIAKAGAAVAGAIGLKDLGQGVCEMKRLYVRDDFKGTGLGRRLSERLIADAKDMGFASMRLDTLPKLKAAIALYRKLGFEEIKPYYFNPIDGVVYFEKSL